MYKNNNLKKFECKVSCILPSSLPPSKVALPLYSSKVQAGFPSPADDYIEDFLDINSRYIKNPTSTFFVTASGNSMIEAGIFSGDVLVVDKSIKPSNGDVIVAAINGELVVKKLCYFNNDLIQLVSANKRYKPISITSEMDMIVWGVVILVLHRLK